MCMVIYTYTSEKTICSNLAHHRKTDKLRRSAEVGIITAYFLAGIA
jgi:hypothetical protein